MALFHVNNIKSATDTLKSEVTKLQELAKSTAGVNLGTTAFNSAIADLEDAVAKLETEELSELNPKVAEPIAKAAPVAEGEKIPGTDIPVPKPN